MTNYSNIKVHNSFSHVDTCKADIHNSRNPCKCSKVILHLRMKNFKSVTCTFNSIKQTAALVEGKPPKPFC